MASHELLMEMKVATSYCFVGGNSIQTGAVDDSEASFFPNIKYRIAGKFGELTRFEHLAK